MANVSVQVDSQQAINSLRATVRATANMAVALAQAERFIRTQVEQTFIQQRDPYGNVWVPLKDSTLTLRKRRGSFSNRILDNSGDMKNSLRSTTSGGEVTLSMDDFSGVHQAGNPLNRIFAKVEAPIPMRRIFPIIDDEVMLPIEWETKITSYFTDLVEGPFK